MRSTGTDSPPELDWAAVRPGQRVSLHHETSLPINGVMDACTEDCSVIWVQMSDGAGRRLIHREDGYRLEQAGEQG